MFANDNEETWPRFPPSKSCMMSNGLNDDNAIPEDCFSCQVIPEQEDMVSDEANLWEHLTIIKDPAPFSHDPRCQQIRDSIDYSKQITYELAKSGKTDRPVRVYADGIYDMFHSGHARQLMQAKSSFPHVYLIVGVCDDKLTHQMKGKTVMNAKERYDAVRHCRYVDEVLSSAPWCTDPDFLEKNKIDFVAHDDLPYGASGQEDIYAWLKKDGRFVATKRTEGISTTDVIARIIKDYDMYVRRNLARGYTAKELNVGFMKEKKIQFQEKYETIKDKGKSLVGKSNELIQKWEDRSREFIGNFLDMFGQDGSFATWLTDKKQKVVRAISPTHSDSGSDPPSPLNFAGSKDFSFQDENESEDDDENAYSDL